LFEYQHKINTIEHQTKQFLYKLSQVASPTPKTMFLIAYPFVFNLLKDNIIDSQDTILTIMKEYFKAFGWHETSIKTIINIADKTKTSYQAYSKI